MHALQPKLKDLLSDINEITDFTSLRAAKKGGEEIRKTLDTMTPGGKKDELDADIELKAASEKAKDYAKSVQEVSKVTEDLMAPLDAASKKENVKAE